jgi:IS30 family transposase
VSDYGSGGRPLTLVQRLVIVHMARRGVSNANIGRVFSVHPRTVTRVLEEQRNDRASLIRRYLRRMGIEMAR